MGFAQLSSVSFGMRAARGRDASAVYPHFGVSHLADELDPAAAGGRGAGPVLDPAAADAAEVVVVDRWRRRGRAA